MQWLFRQFCKGLGPSESVAANIANFLHDRLSEFTIDLHAHL
ncbi:hypothetical protein [Neisseria weixii]|nr:hypothetical protein [Neisseria weixii]